MAPNRRIIRNKSLILPATIWAKDKPINLCINNSGIKVTVTTTAIKAKIKYLKLFINLNEANLRDFNLNKRLCALPNGQRRAQKESFLIDKPSTINKRTHLERFQAQGAGQTKQ